MKTWVTPHLVQSLNEAIDSAIELTGADFGNIQLLDAGGRLKIVAQRHFPTWWLEYWEAVADGQGVCGIALKQGERVIVEDVEMSPVFVGTPALDFQRRAGIRAVQSTPVRAKSGQWIGMFSTHYRVPSRPDAKSLKVLDLLAVQVATLVEHAHAEQHEKFLRLSMEAANAGSWKLNLATGVVTASERTLQLHNVPSGTPATHALALACHYPEDRERIDAAIRHTAETGEPFATELRVLMPDGATRWLASFGERIEEAEQPCIVGLVLDITERKRLQEQLVASESHYRSVVEDQTEVIGRFLPDGTFVFANEVYCRLFGKPLEKLIGKRWHPVAHPDDLPMIEAKLGEMSADNPIVTIENRVFVANGELRWMQFVNRGLYQADGVLREIQSVGRDITALKHAEAALQESEARLQHAQAVARIGSFALKGDSDRFFHTRETARLFDLENSPEINFGDWFSRVHPDDQATVEAAWSAALRGAPYDLTYRIVVRGQVIWIRAVADLSIDEHGQLIECVGTLQDITEQKQIETELDEYRNELERAVADRTEELAAKSALLELALSSAEFGTWNFDFISGRAVHDERYCALLGYTPDEFGHTIDAWHRRIHPDDRDVVKAATKAHEAGETPSSQLSTLSLKSRGLT